MTTTRWLLLLSCAAALAPAARAHLTPIDPSTCALDVTLTLPDAGLTAAVDPPAPGDLERFTYNPDTSPTQSLAQACPADPADPAGRCGAVVPRGFVIGGTAGTLALPAVFVLRMLSSGDLDATVPITFTAGGPPVAVPFTLTTGFALGGAAPVLGAPLDAGGAMRLVGYGASDALPPPLGGSAIEIALACVHAPPPDRDQFAPAPRLTKVRGILTAKKTKLVMTLESELSFAVDPTGSPTVLRVARDEVVLMEQLVALQPGPRGRFVSSGATLTVSPLARKGVRAQKIVLREPVGQTGLAGGEGMVALETGGLMARRGVSLKANRRGTRLAVRER
jgi:hypothetical protein